MALENMDLKTKRLVSFRRGTNREGEKREEEKRKKKKRRREGERSSKKVWKLTLIMNSMRFGMDLWVCMMIILLKPRVLLGFHLSPKIMESKVGRTPYGTR